MASLNKVQLIGSLGRDPEMRYMPNGEAVANFSIATTETWKDKSGNKQEKTEWHNIVMYRRLAEIAGEYLKKGRPVYIEGRLQTRKWEKDGITRYSTEIVAHEMQMLGSGNQGDNQSGNASGNSGQRQGNQNAQSASANQGGGDGNFNQNYDDQNFGSGDGFDDDIPFVSNLMGHDPMIRKAVRKF